MDHTTETHICVKIPCFLNADAAMRYNGPALPCGLMPGDLVFLHTTNQVANRGLAAVQDGEETLLCRLFHNGGGVTLAPLDPSCPPREFAEDSLPRVVGEVMGWAHSLLHEETDREGVGQE